MSQIKLADRMARMTESATMAMDARAKQLAAEGKVVYNLTAGELAASTPDYVQEHVKNVLHENKYTNVAGVPELRQLIAENAKAFYGLDWVQAENVVVTAGAKPALTSALLALISSGDEVIVPIPAWVSYNHLIELAAGKVVEVPLGDNYDLDVDATMAAVTPKTKAILLNSPQNPTGTIFSEASQRDLATRLKGTDIIVISDDIYGKLIYTDNYVPTPACGFEHIVMINGFSKSQALTGWRIGYVIAEKSVAKAISTILSHATGNAAVPSQQAALAALKKVDDTPPQSTLDILARQRQMVDDALKTVSGLTYKLPDGAFYYFLDVRELNPDSGQWCEDLLNQTGVVLVPGEAFSAPGFARLSFVTDETVLAKALELIKQFATKS